MTRAVRSVVHFKRSKDAAREAEQAANNPNYVPPEYRTEFAALNIELQGLVNRIYSASDPRDEGQIAQVLPDTVDAGIRWTRLSEKGYFVPLSTPVSEAFASITFGLMHKEEHDHVMEGTLMIRAAMDKMAEDYRQQQG